MFISYFDEAGDDGYPQYSSELFVLTSIYMDNRVWRYNYNKIIDFRRKLRDMYNIPVKLEFHTKYFITDKNPYRNYGFDSDTIKNIIFQFFCLISKLNLRIINVVINKKNILRQDYPVLDNALSYNIQRIENDLNKINNLFIIITDEGRVGKMRKTSRRIQKINFIPSKVHQGTYRKEIERLIEDPLPKDSSESYFIQLSDLIAYIVYLYSLTKFNNSKWANRVANKLTYSDEVQCLLIIKDKLNIEASQKDFGIVHYPRI